MNFTITIDGLSMQCRLFQRRGGMAGGSWVLSGYVGNEERMSCDVTTTVKRYANRGTRLFNELMETARIRLQQIVNE